MMGAGRAPGPTGDPFAMGGSAYKHFGGIDHAIDRGALDDGTLVRAQSPAPGPVGLAGESAAAAPAEDVPLSGAIPYSIGLASVVRIPVPGTQGLCIEFSPRGWVPKGGSTSTLFFQDLSGKRHLRLDYGYNVKTKTIDYHWNQKGTSANFGIADHAPAGRSGAAAYQAAKYFKYAGRVLLVAGVAIDVISVVQADKPLRQASRVVTGWAAAWAGCKVVGGAGAAGGLAATPLGSAALGVGGCIIGGTAGYFIGSSVAGVVYDWAEDTLFTPLEETTAP
jgi:hypothetical protein